MTWWEQGVLTVSLLGSVLINGNPVGPILTLGVLNGWTQFMVNFTATGSTTLTFTALLNAITFLDDVSITLAIICYSGKSLVHAKNVETGEISDVTADSIVAGKYEVFNVDKNEFVPVIYNAISSPTKRYMRIKKNLLGENVPHTDFDVTSGHYLMINGERIKAGKIPGAKRIKVKPEHVYTICVPESCPILINGLHVMAWGKDELEAKNILWKENSLE